MRLSTTSLLAGLLFIIIFTGCKGDFRDLSQGNINEIVVVMDSTQWNSKTAEAIRGTFGKYVFTLPNPESFYDLSFTTIVSKGQLKRLLKSKNIIFAAPIDEDSNVGRQIRAFLDDGSEERVREGKTFAMPVEDQWYKDQYVLILSSTSDSALAEKIINSDEVLINNLLEKNLKRWAYEVYDNLEQVQYSDSLWDEHGFKVRIQHDYVKRIDTTDFVSYRRSLPNNDRWFWIWWKEGVKDINFLDNDWINATRDSLNQAHIKGSTDSMYVTTEYRRPVNTHTFEKDRYFVYETLGTWQMINGAMGGPFVNFTYFDPATHRLFMIEYSQFAPSVRKKLLFVRQFRAMGRTFESDSTWTGENRANK